MGGGRRHQRRRQGEDLVPPGAGTRSAPADGEPAERDRDQGRRQDVDQRPRRPGAPEVAGRDEDPQPHHAPGAALEEDEPVVGGRCRDAGVAVPVDGSDVRRRGQCVPEGPQTSADGVSQGHALIEGPSGTCRGPGSSSSLHDADRRGSPPREALPTTRCGARPSRADKPGRRGRHGEPSPPPKSGRTARGDVSVRGRALDHGTRAPCRFPDRTVGGPAEEDGSEGRASAVPVSSITREPLHGLRGGSVADQRWSSIGRWAARVSIPAPWD